MGRGQKWDDKGAEMKRANHRNEKGASSPCVWAKQRTLVPRCLFALCSILSAIHSVEISRRQMNAVRRHSSLHLRVSFCHDSERVSEEVYSVNCAKTLGKYQISLALYRASVTFHAYLAAWTVKQRGVGIVPIPRIGGGNGQTLQWELLWQGKITNGENNSKDKSLCWKTKIGTAPADCRCVYLDKISWVEEISRIENDAVESPARDGNSLNEPRHATCQPETV